MPIQPNTHSDLQTATAPELVRLLVDGFHHPLRGTLPRLVALAREVEAVGKRMAGYPRGIAEHLEQMSQALIDHLEKEEKILFPMVLAGRGTLAMMPIRAMMGEHEDHQESLRLMRGLTFDYRLPEPAPASWRSLYQALRHHEETLAEHIQIENHVLFERALRGEF
jgi:regulator of cell morphogenesis and NO signaling